MFCTYCLWFEMKKYKLMLLETIVLQLSRCLAKLVSVAHLERLHLENFVHESSFFFTGFSICMSDGRALREPVLSSH